MSEMTAQVIGGGVGLVVGVILVIVFEAFLSWRRER